MRQLIFILFMIVSFNLSAQQNGNTIQLKFSCVPASTYSYSYSISKSEIIQTTYDKIPKKIKLFKNSPSIRRTITTTYSHHLNNDEKATLDRIIKHYSLDSVELYLDRDTDWGMHWEITITRDAITYNIELPNFYNPGLDSLLQFMTCIIPEEEQPRFTCKKCELKNEP
jgi:hypothetical protein